MPSNTAMNWGLALFTAVVWIGSLTFYFKSDIKLAYERWKTRRAERRAASKP